MLQALDDINIGVFGLIFIVATILDPTKATSYCDGLKIKPTQRGVEPRDPLSMNMSNI